MADDETLRRHFETVMREPDSPHVSDETWEALALHELPAVERAAVMRHVVTCAECGDLYRSLRGLEDGAREFDDGVPSATAPVTSNHAWPALAASVALVIGGFVAYRAFVLPAPAIEMAQPAAPVATLARIEVVAPDVRLSASRALARRGAGDQQAFLEAFGKAIDPYRNGRYADAASALAAVATAYPDAYEPLFYQAVSTLLAGDHGAARGLFARAQPIAPAELQDEIRWYRAAASQRANDIEAARAELRMLCDGASAYRERACALLK